MRLFTIEDQNNLSEARRVSEKRVLELAEVLLTGRVTEARGLDVGEQFLAEAHKLEKLTIVEGLSDQDFNQLQKNFRSLLRPAGSLVKNLAGTDLADRLDVLRISGTELLNDMYEDVKDVEGGVSNPLKSKHTSQLRDKFAKTFADFAILVKGSMALGDLFGDDPSSVGNHAALGEIVASLESDGLLSVPLKDAFVAYAQSVKDNGLSQSEKDDVATDKWFDQGDNETHWDADAGKAPAVGPRKDNKPFGGMQKKPGFFARLFGKKKNEDAGPARDKVGTSLLHQVNYKQSPMEKKFRQVVQKALIEKSPGFARMVNIPKLMDALMGKSYDHLAAIFGRFNDFVSNDVDVDFLKQVIQKPLSVSSAMKSVWDAFSGGNMTGMGRGRG